MARRRTALVAWRWSHRQLPMNSVGQVQDERIPPGTA
jgi:hypothetical protein